MRCIFQSHTNFRMSDVTSRASVVDQFFKQIRPSFKPPNWTAVGTNELDKHYNEMKMKLNNKISNSENLNLQCDGWSNIRNESIINFLITVPEPIFIEF